MQQNCFHIAEAELFAGIPFYNDVLKVDRETWFVGFDTTNLNFGGEYAPGFLIYTGGEWHHKEPFWFQGKDPTDIRPWRLQKRSQQIWKLFTGERLAVADRRCGLRFVKAMPHGPELHIPEPLEVVRYLYDRAAAMAARKNSKGLHWVSVSIGAISQVGQHAEIEGLQEAVRKLQSQQVA